MKKYRVDVFKSRQDDLSDYLSYFIAREYVEAESAEKARESAKEKYNDPLYWFEVMKVA